MKDSQSGRSMVEMLGVISIIGVLSVGGIAGYSKAMERWRIYKTANQISYILTHIRTLYRSQINGYQKLDSTNNPIIINKTESFPKEMMEKGKVGSYVNMFQGKVTAKASCRDFCQTVDPVSGDVEGFDDNLSFILTYTGIPRRACISLATMDWGTGSNGGLVAMGINIKIDDVTTGQCTKSLNQATAAALGNIIICERDGVMGPSEASTACSSEANNTIYFKFR